MISLLRWRLGSISPNIVEYLSAFTTKTNIACVIVSLTLFSGAVCRGQQMQPANDASQQDCQVNPDAPGCQPNTRPLPGAGNDRNTTGGSQGTPTSMQSPDLLTYGPQEESDRQRSARFPSQREPELPPQPPTEFQRMVTDSTGQMLPIFGASLFRQPPSTFAPLENVPVPADYVIGPGDELYVRVWGQINVELRATVDRNGAVFVPKVGSMVVAGVHFSQLDNYFHQQIERVYRNFDVAVTLGKLRSIDVFLVGRAQRPGNYTIGSLSTLVNAIFAVGGPASEGSMRRKPSEPKGGSLPSSPAGKSGQD